MNGQVFSPVFLFLSDGAARYRSVQVGKGGWYVGQGRGCNGGGGGCKGGGVCV